MKTTKDPIITVRSTMRGRDSKERDVLTLYIGGAGERNEGQVDALIAALIANKDNPTGIKLKVHTEKKEYNGRAFDSSFFFVSPVGDGASAPMTRRAAPTRTDTKAQIANLKAGKV